MTDLKQHRLRDRLKQGIIVSIGTLFIFSGVYTVVSSASEDYTKSLKALEKKLSQGANALNDKRLFKKEMDKQALELRKKADEKESRGFSELQGQELFYFKDYCELVAFKTERDIPLLNKDFEVFCTANFESRDVDVYVKAVKDFFNLYYKQKPEVKKREVKVIVEEVSENDYSGYKYNPEIIKHTPDKYDLNSKAGLKLFFMDNIEANFDKNMAKWADAQIMAEGNYIPNEWARYASEEHCSWGMFQNYICDDYGWSIATAKYVYESLEGMNGAEAMAKYEEYRYLLNPVFQTQDLILRYKGRIKRTAHFEFTDYTYKGVTVNKNIVAAIRLHNFGAGTPYLNIVVNKYIALNHHKN